MEVVDLCDSEDELPPPLVARLQQRETTGVGKQAHTKQQSAALAPQAASGRPPLLAVLQNQAAPSSQPSTGSMHWEASRSQPSYADGGGNLLAGAEALRRRQQARAARKAAKDAAAAVAIQEDASMGSWQASSPQPQRRQPEQGAQQDGPGCGASPAAGHRDSPTGGQATSQVEPAQQQQQQQEPWELPSWQEQGLDDAGGDADWRPPGGSQRARRRSSAGAVAPLGPDRGQQQPAAKKPRQPKRTKQEQEQAQALKARAQPGVPASPTTGRHAVSVVGELSKAACGMEGAAAAADCMVRGASPHAAAACPSGPDRALCRCSSARTASA